MVEKRTIIILACALIGAISYASATGRYQAIPMFDGKAIAVIDTIFGSASWCNINFGTQEMECEPRRDKP